jgi:hypothetical protein
MPERITRINSEKLRRILLHVPATGVMNVITAADAARRVPGRLIQLTPEAVGSAHSQIHIVCDLCGSFLRSFTQIAFRSSLHAPGDAPEQVRTIGRRRRFSKQLPVAQLQLPDLQLAQALDFGMQNCVHGLSLVAKVFSYESRNALSPRQSKWLREPH